ncbi:hypothetical protein Bca4012_062664 [Brassica carinata]
MVVIQKTGVHVDNIKTLYTLIAGLISRCSSLVVYLFVLLVAMQQHRMIHLKIFLLHKGYTCERKYKVYTWICS